MEFLGTCLHHAFLNVFSVGPMKCFCLQGLINSNSFVFENADFGELNQFWRAQFNNEIFLKMFSAMEDLSMRLPYVKYIFPGSPVKCFLFMAQITQILLFSGMNVLERSKITVQQRLTFKKFLPWKFQICRFLT